MLGNRIFPLRSWHSYALRSFRPFVPLPRIGHGQHYHNLFSPSSGKYRRTRLMNVKLFKRTFLSDVLPPFLVPPVVFTGLLLTLWTYKCIMTVLFQDKIVYMPYMPPFARSEKVEDYLKICSPVEWTSRSIRSLDGTRLSICVGKLPNEHSSRETKSPADKEIVICYFHGNGSSLPPRLPLLSGVLRAIDANASEAASSVQYTIIALSYRGYWTSSGRASQNGIEQDAQALLHWISTGYGSDEENIQVVLWGQSIGAGVASTAAACWSSTNQPQENIPVIGLVLETPFTSIKSMLISLYPQKWLPYRYLWPFLWSHWDTEAALRQIAKSGHRMQILLVPATRDEVVPPEEADKLASICRDLKLPTIRKDVIGALHTNATIRRDGQDVVAGFVLDITKPSKDE